MNIKGKMVTLRAVDYKDMEFMREMLNDPELEKLVVGWSFPISATEQEKWFASAIQDKTNLRFVIETKEEGPVGISILSGIDWKNRKALHGIKLSNTETRKKGLGTDTIMAIMRYAFDELNLNRLDANWLEDNMASQKLHIKCGWSVEGCRRNYIYKSGSYKKLILAGILKTDYYHLIQENHYWESEEK